jgi:SAM-dependent methyltransferase
MSQFDADYWEDRYRGHDHRAGGTQSPPAHPALQEAVAEVSPGTALEAGCGAGANAIWLARLGWQVTAVDIAENALRRGREAARLSGAEVADRLDWQQRDLTTWSPPEDSFDLVASFYVHPAGPMADFFGLLARAVAPAGTLLLVGHDPTDPHALAHGGDAVAWTADEVAALLDPGHWEVQVAETVVRRGSGAHRSADFHDAVLRAQRR